MKKLYEVPQLQVCDVESEQVMASSSLSTDGSENVGILPSEDVFDGTFQSNEESDMDLW